MKPVLILSTDDDVHAQAVERTLKNDFGVDSDIWDFSRFPDDLSQFNLGNRATSFLIRDREIDEYRSVWWRRPGQFKISPKITDEHARSFCLRECDSYILGAFVSTEVSLINHPFHQRQAEYKPCQLATAQRAGLKIPESILSNDSDLIREFWKSRNGDVIYKTFRHSPVHALETRVMSEEDLAELDKVRYAPLIVQQRIDKLADIRVNVFGNQLFAADVTIKNPVADLDWRIDVSAEWQPHCLPADITQRLLDFMAALNLDYGCIDLRLTPENDYVFFEVNPAGQFLFVEIDTGQPLCRALAALLAGQQEAAASGIHEAVSG